MSENGCTFTCTKETRAVEEQEFAEGHSENPKAKYSQTILHNFACRVACAVPAMNEASRNTPAVITEGPLPGVLGKWQQSEEHETCCVQHPSSSSKAMWQYLTIKRHS
jgi:hypothetical protein